MQKGADSGPARSPKKGQTHGGPGGEELPEDFRSWLGPPGVITNPGTVAVRVYNPC